ncbi:MAG: radical SAM protein [Nanoarchaeota archaeon]
MSVKPAYHIAKELLKSNITRLNTPVKATFAITYACTFQCKTCNIGRNYLKNPSAIKKDELTDEEIGRVFGDTKINWLNITGGEPFMRDMYSALKMVVEKNDRLYLSNTTTNGFATDHIVNSVEKILTLDIPRFLVSISVDGFEKDNDEIRGIKNSFKQCMETFNRLKALENKKFDVSISYTSSQNNMGKIGDFVRNMKNKYDVDSKYIHMNLYHTSEHYYKNLTVEEMKRAEEYNKHVLEEIKAYQTAKKEGFRKDAKIDSLEKRYYKFAKKYVETGRSPLPCKALNSSFFMDPYGNVFPCIIWDNKIGNVRDFDYSIKKMWQIEKAKEAQKNAYNLNCPQCWTPCEAYQTIAGNLKRTLF